MISINGELYVRSEFPDGTRKMQGEMFDPVLPENWDCFQIRWFYDSEDELIDLMYIAMHLSERGTPCKLFMPYIPNARNDRAYNDSEVLSLKYFAQIINDLGFDSVTVLDPHSHVSEALIDRVHVHHQRLERLIKRAAERTRDITGADDLTLCYPDEGAMKRYTDLVPNPYVFGIKKRDWKTGNILGLDVMGDPALIEGKNILIVDDICSKGGTFYHTSKKLKEMGASKVFLYVTHCENTIFEGELLKDNGLIDRIFTTNSIFRGEHEKIEVFKL